MIIETKYNVGDKVWFLNEKREPQSDIITSIMTHTDGNNLAVSYFFANHSPRSQKDVYESKRIALLYQMDNIVDELLNKI